MATLELRCLGELTFKQDGVPVVDFKSGKGQALLAIWPLPKNGFYALSWPGFSGRYAGDPGIGESAQSAQPDEVLSPHLMVGREAWLLT